MEEKINHFTELLKNTMSVKCRMIFTDNSNCFNEGSCDGHCVLFKSLINKYAEDLKNIK